MSSRLARIERRIHTRHVRFGPKLVRLAPNGRNPGLFQISVSQIVLKSDLKSPTFVQFGANLTHLGNKSDHPDTRVVYILHKVHADCVLFDVSTLPIWHNVDCVT